VDIRVDWQTFNVRADDRQLLDLLVTYGRAFPPKDRSGREIVVERDDGTSLTEDDCAEMQQQVDEAVVSELAASRPRLISLNLREHDGQAASAPYSIEPSQLVRTACRLCFYRAFEIKLQVATVTSCLQCFDAVGWAAGRASGL